MAQCTTWDCVRYSTAADPALCSLSRSISSVSCRACLAFAMRGAIHAATTWDRKAPILPHPFPTRWNKLPESGNHSDLLLNFDSPSPRSIVLSAHGSRWFVHHTSAIIETQNNPARFCEMKCLTTECRRNKGDERRGGGRGGGESHTHARRSPRGRRAQFCGTHVVLWNDRYDGRHKETSSAACQRLGY